MCGIAGILDNNFSETELRNLAQLMADRIAHRGPDSHGEWASDGVAFAHRRLSILDLSSAGHQPMESASRRYVIIFNGEIYNHLFLRQELEQYSINWRGTSDTETLLHAIDCWGFEETLKKSKGMFALALWDKKMQELLLARDRMGEKPLYYGWVGKTFLFASELKALRAFPGFEGTIDREALSLYMQYRCVPTPKSIYKNISKLEQGCFLRVQYPKGDMVSKPYWSCHAIAEAGLRDPFEGDEEEMRDQLSQRLRQSVALQMVADVPVGAFLSGGIDSTTIVALMQAQSTKPVHTFTIGFHEKEYNEANHARRIADYLGTEHKELYITPKDAMEVIPYLPEMYDEPFAGSSNIPTFLLSKLARQDVTVSLSGDGGDELFCGYSRYLYTRKIHNLAQRLPFFLRHFFARLLSIIPISYWNHVFLLLKPFMAQEYHQAGPRMHALAQLLTKKNPKSIYSHILSSYYDTQDLVIGAPSHLIENLPLWRELGQFEENMMYHDSQTYFPDDVLTKIDRASMAVSLECRVPFLDPDIIAFSWRLPLSVKLRDGQGKWLLRQLLYQYVPEKIVTARPKQGFSVPIEHWLRGSLRDWAEALLDKQRLKREGYFDPMLVRHKWQQHLSGVTNHQSWLWNILMFQAWMEHTNA